VEQKAVRKRDEINIELRELNKRLQESGDMKKEKVKDSKKTVKLVSLDVLKLAVED